MLRADVGHARSLAFVGGSLKGAPNLAAEDNCLACCLGAFLPIQLLNSRSDHLCSQASVEVPVLARSILLYKADENVFGGNL